MKPFKTNPHHVYSLNNWGEVHFLLSNSGSGSGPKENIMFVRAIVICLVYHLLEIRILQYLHLENI